MFKRKTGMLAMMALSALSAPAMADTVPWTWKYEADVAPDVTGSIVERTGPGTYVAASQFTLKPTTTVTSPAAGVQQISTLDSEAAGNDATGRYEATGDPIVFNSDTGFTVEWRVKPVTIVGNNTKGSVGVYVGDSRASVERWWYMGIGRDSTGSFYAGLVVSSDVQRAPISANEFSTLRMVVLGTTATLYVNGDPTPVDTATPFPGLDRPGVWMGDITGSAQSSYQVDYLYGYDGIAVPVPEPGSLALVGVGALVMLKRRR